MMQASPAGAAAKSQKQIREIKIEQSKEPDHLGLVRRWKGETTTRNDRLELKQEKTVIVA